METSELRSPLLDKWTQDELRYSTVWEDFRCLEKAAQSLASAPKNMLSIGSSGENALGLLTLDPENLVILDLSPAQVSLTELKISAIKMLSFEEFVVLFGGTASDSRSEAIFQKLLPDLSPRAARYWVENYSSIQNGILYQGRLDTYFKKFREQIVPKVWDMATLEALLYCQDLKEQNQLWQKGNLELLKKAVSEFFSKSALSREGRHASQFEHVSQENIGPIFLKNFSKLLSTSLISENPYLYLFLSGHVLTGKHATPVFNPEDYAVIKERLTRVRIFCQDLESYLSNCPFKFDFMNLSDIFEYLSEDETQKLFNLLDSKLSGDGGVAYWTLLVDRKPIGGLHVNDIISRSISAADQTWFYSSFNLAVK